MSAPSPAEIPYTVRRSERARRARRARAPSRRRLRRGGAKLQRPAHPGAAHALGLLLLARADELQLAPAARARARARIRRLARGLPSAGARPLAALLGAARAPLARLARGSRLAQPERRDAGAVNVGTGEETPGAGGSVTGPSESTSATRCARV